MATLRKTVLAAIVKSLLRGKSLIQAILAYWVSPLAPRTDMSQGGLGTRRLKTVQEFLKDAEAAFLGPVSGDGLVGLSRDLKKQFYIGLQSNPECMLPSYSHQLPLGNEKGQYLALDVGGSTLRVALVELRGREADVEKRSEIVSIQNFRIDKAVKDLEGMAFFEWMAARIKETLESRHKDIATGEPLPMALAWSFPIDQTSLAGGLLQGMGKGFKANHGLLGRDLGELVKEACQRLDLRIELKAIINDSSACLISQAYSHTSTRFGLILGTGFNVSAYLPVSTIGLAKFGKRPDGWFDEATHVIVNTELSMFGGGVLPLTRWDKQLLAHHSRPDFQPLEHLLSGMYLGEIARLALIDAIETSDIFGGVVPSSLTTTYALGTDLMSFVESDSSSDLAESAKLFAQRHPSSHDPTTDDMAAFRELCSYISIRSSAIIATCVYTLWELRLEAQQEFIDSLPESSPRRPAALAEMTLPTTMVSFNGSVLENYPRYIANCQRYLKDLIEGKGRPELGDIDLVPARESSLLGAAVTLACVEAGS